MIGDSQRNHSMYTSTRGLVFRQTKYAETSLVVKIFTEEYGLRSYMVKGVRSPKSKFKASLFQPLTLLDLVIPEKTRGDLQIIREARVSYAYKTLHGDIHKSSVLIFLNELLYKSIQEEASNKELFNYILDQLMFLDQTDHVSGSYPLLFALNLTRHLGFFPQERPLPARTVFDLQEGRFTTSGELFAENMISGEQCAYFISLLPLSPENHLSVSLPPAIRLELLEKILVYFRLHLPISGDFKSHIVLHEVLKK